MGKKGEQDVQVHLQAMETSVEALRQGIGRPSRRGNGQHLRDWWNKEDQCIFFNHIVAIFGHVTSVMLV